MYCVSQYTRNVLGVILHVCDDVVIIVPTGDVEREAWWKESRGTLVLFFVFILIVFKFYHIQYRRVRSTLSTDGLNRNCPTRGAFLARGRREISRGDVNYVCNFGRKVNVSRKLNIVIFIIMSVAIHNPKSSVAVIKFGSWSKLTIFISISNLLFFITWHDNNFTHLSWKLMKKYYVKHKCT